MNLISRSVTRVISSSSLNHSRAAKLPTRKWVISRQISGGGGGRTAPFMSSEKELGQLKETEYQREISNSVSLIGFVDSPVQFDSSSDGKFWAGTVISHGSKSNSSSFWVPIIFGGDLARIAAQHLKKDDRIHISGKLFVDSPPPNVTCAQSNVQVMVQNLNFIQAIHPAKTISPPEKEEISTKKQPARSKKVQVIDEETSNSWKHLLANPKEWLDHRGNKTSGLVKPRHPDFKCKDGGLPLWLNKAPDWVLPNLKGLEFDVLVPKGKPKLLKGEESWKDLVQNPDKWLDNRSEKTNAKAPDFKHKETGEALWMTDSPTWVLSKLPPLKKKQEGALVAKTVSEPIPKQPKREEFWKDLVENPDKWWDNRSGKRNAKAPDFKHKESGEVLWMTDSPTWVLSKLPPLKKKEEGSLMAGTVSQPILKQDKREEFWKDLVENPDKWWDNRSGKTNVKAPDFKHKETGEALWMSNSPSWVLSNLPPLKKKQERPVMA